MTLHSALEDLRATTLKALSSSLRKLEYVAGLRSPEGTYVHWGLERTHGQIAASKAIDQEHHLLVSTVLSTPLEHLLEDVEHSSRSQEITPTQYLERLTQNPGLLPSNPGAGSELHLSSTLRALLSLVKHPRGANRLVS